MHNGYRAVVRFTWDGNKKTWLVTNFLDKKIKNPDSADDFVRSAPTTDDTISSSEQSSSTSTVPQNQQNVKGKNLRSVIIGGEKYYIEDMPNEPTPKSGKKKESASSKKKNVRTNEGKYGNEVEIRTDDGKKIKSHYALIPADKLIASNKADDTLSKNEAYPQELQPRDRQRTAMRLQVDSMANSLRPEDLADSRNPNQGAPIVRGDLTVLNGNGRTLAIQRAYQSGKAEEYKQYLLDNAEKLGLDKSQVAAMVKGKQPILVRVVDDLSEGDTQSVINSTTGGQRMGATEQARADAKKIKPDTLRKYAENNKGDLTAAANEEFLGDVLKDIVPANERNAYMTKDGKINKDGLARAERALFSRAYGDESLLEDFGENLNEEARNMTNALRNNAPAIARLQQKIKEGNAHDIGLQKNLVEAVKAIKKAVKENKPAQSIWEEQSMFEDTAYSPETIEIAKVLHDLRRSGRKLTAFMGKLADLNEQHGNPKKDEDLFAGEELAEPSLMNDIPIANEYAEELTKAKYSRDAENQLDNQGKKADNEIVSRYDDLPDEYKAIVDEAVEKRTNALLDRVVKSVSEKFSENFTAEDAKLGVSVLVEDKGRKAIVLNDLMVNASRYVSHPSNYREVLHRLMPRFSTDNKTREELVEAYNKYKKIAEEMLEYGSYTYSELCRRLHDRAGRYAESSTRTGIDRGAAENRAFKRSPERIKTIIDFFKEQETQKLRIPKHPHEEQNSRDVSAFSFAGNPLSEEALKAKAEFETPLDKLEKVSRERLRKVERNIQDFGKRIGVPVHFVYHPDRGYRGVCIHNGSIYINLNSNVPARRIFMHEFVHWLKASGEDNNKIFKALASVIETKQGTLNEVRMNEYRRTLYGGEEMSGIKIRYKKTSNGYT